MILFCPKCGAKAPDDKALFCNKCGNKLPVSIPEKKDIVCKNCGTKILDPQSQFCDRCGHQVSSPILAKVVLTEQLKMDNIKKCSACGASIEDENRYYCKSCGAYLLGDQSEKTSPNKNVLGKKPDILVASSRISSVPQSDGVYIPPITHPIGQHKKTSVQKAPASHSLLYYAGWLIIGIILAELFTGYINFSQTQMESVLTSNSNTLIIQDLPSMALTINDLPTGWMSQGGGGTSNSYSIDFLKTTMYSGGMVKLIITRYSTIEQAKQEYILSRAQAPTNVKIESIYVGNEGFAYIYETDAWAIFRRANIVVKIEDVRDEYQIMPTTNNVENFAEIVANRIK